MKIIEVVVYNPNWPLAFEVEAEKIFATESRIIDVCADHHKQLMEKVYK